MMRVTSPENGFAHVSAVLVGRDEEIALAIRRWQRAREGAGHLLLVSGEAGIGKSRLLREVRERIGDEAIAVSAAAFPRDAEAAGGLLLDLADGFRRAGLTDVADALRSSLVDEAAGDGDSARRRRLLVGDLTERIVTALEIAPTLLLVEDVHWADELSLDVLDRLSTSVSHTRGMVIVSYRSDELFPRSPLRRWRVRLLRQRLAEEVRLARLDAHGTVAMMEAITGSVPASTAAMALHDRSDGIPLHIEELLASDGSPGVPDSVAEAVIDRVATLSSHARGIVSAAAVIGRSFDSDLLESITAEGSDTIDRALVELADRQLLMARGDTATYDFRHALIRDAIYADISPRRRRQLHTAVADAAARVGLRDSFVSDHYEHGGQQELAHRFSLIAAKDAARVSAHREAAELYFRAERTAAVDSNAVARAKLHEDLAVELAAIDDSEGAAAHFEAALDLYRDLGDEISAANVISRLMAAKHLLGVGFEARAVLARDTIMRLDGLPDGGPPVVRACVIAGLAAANMLERRLDEAILLGREAAALAVGPGAVEERMNVDLTLGSVLVFAGRAAEGWQLLEDAIGVGLAIGLEEETARGYRLIGSSASAVVEYSRARQWIADGLDYTSRTERWNDHHYLNAHLAHVDWAEGRWDQAEAVAKQALADSGDGVTTRITALYVLGYLAMGRGHREAARDLLDEARELGEQMNELQRLSPPLWGLAELALRGGDASSASELCERGFTESARVDDSAYLYPFVVTGARAYLELHDSVAARSWLLRTSGLINSRGIPGTIAALHHADGLIHLAEGQTGKARAALELANEQWMASNRHWELVESYVDLARCAVRSRRPLDAAKYAANARALTEGCRGMLSDDFEAALVVADGVATDFAPLSPREFEVAKLVTEGSTNRDIALKLTISPKTASSHIEHILAKLGASRRAEIAAWVTRQT